VDGTEETTEALKDFTEQTEKASKAAGGVGEGARAAGGTGKGLSDIYKLLEENLTELKTYAHAA
jgi:hypothetical protein